MTDLQIIVMIGAIALGTAMTRFIPFLLFPENKNPPEVIAYLGRVLPPAMMGLLVMYCLKNVSVTSRPYGIPELASIFVIVILHKWKRNVLLSIGGGTFVYMIFMQVILPAISL